MTSNNPSEKSMEQFLESLGVGMAPEDSPVYQHPPIVTSMPSTGSPDAGTTRSRTPEEQRILNAIARERGQAFVDRHAELILEQARQVGDL
jgi:hypothetical protein